MVNARAAAPVLLATYGSPGDLQPFLAIGLALERSGQPVIIATSEVYRDRVTKLGLAFAPVRPDRDPQLPDPDFLERVRRGERPAGLVRDMFMPGLWESTVDLIGAASDACAIVSHTLVGGGRLAAEVRGLPWISVVMQPMGYFPEAEPPVIGPPGLAAALRALGRPATRAILRSARDLSLPWVRPWQDLRAELGLPPSSHHPLFEGQHSGLRSLGIFPRVLGEPQTDWPPAARVTGFPFLRDPARRLLPELVDFLDAGTPPVVFTLGTTAVNEPGHFYEVSARAVRQLGLRAVLVTGPNNAVAAGDDQTIAVPWAPHDLLFARSCAVVHQGGIGTLAEAISAGRPMVIVPYAHDQADNAWRASRLGVGETLPRRRYHPRDLARTLQRILNSRRCEAACHQARCEMAREHGAQSAADAIKQVIAHRVRTSTLASSGTM
ncbi:MAG: glycosyltransferase family 1 protein [Thermomicrobiales bacterium]|nr:glycosyltransferase family 1 protein [Thermomicrobiales bacterium]